MPALIALALALGAAFLMGRKFAGTRPVTSIPHYGEMIDAKAIAALRGEG